MVTLVVDGKVVTRKSDKWEPTLQAWQALAVGRLKVHGGQRLTVDELRVYRVPLSPEWIREIRAVPAAQ